MEVTPLQKHIDWIDICKFIGIYLVIFGHSLLTFNLLEFTFYKNIFCFISQFHMPLFFILAGYLYKQKTLKENFFKILYGLIIPYFIYQIIYFPFQYCNKILIKHAEMVPTLLEMIKSLFLGDGYGYCVCAPCWFIMSMIELRFLLMFIKINKYNLLIISTISILLLKFFLINGIDLKFCLDNTIMAIPYFILGIYISLCQTQYNRYIVNFKKYDYLIIIILFLFMIYLTYLTLHNNGLIEMNLQITEAFVNKSILIAYCVGIIGSLICILIGKKLECFNNLFVKTISQNTLFIIFSHTLILFITKWVGISHLFMNLNNKYTFLFCILYCFIILIINYILIPFISKNWPIILGKYKLKEGVK